MKILTEYRTCKVYLLKTASTSKLIFYFSLKSISHYFHVIFYRSVADNQRSFALGIQFLIMRSLSFLPGSITMGAVVDSQCTTWMLDKCGNKLNCADYNVDTLSRNLVIFALITTGKYPEVCPEPCKRSKIKLFLKIVTQKVLS